MPVRLFLDRRAEHLGVGNRPSSIQRLRLGASKDGALQAIALESFGSAGCAAGAGCAGPAKNLYPAAAVRTEENDVFLHTGPGGRLPRSRPSAGRLRARAGHGRAGGEARHRSGGPARQERRASGATRRAAHRREKFGWDPARARKSSGPVKRGVGFAQGLWYNFDGSPSNAEVLSTTTAASSAAAASRTSAAASAPPARRWWRK